MNAVVSEPRLFEILLEDVANARMPWRFSTWHCDDETLRVGRISTLSLPKKKFLQSCVESDHAHVAALGALFDASRGFAEDAPNAYPPSAEVHVAPSEAQGLRHPHARVGEDIKTDGVWSNLANLKKHLKLGSRQEPRLLFGLATLADALDGIMRSDLLVDAPVVERHEERPPSVEGGRSPLTFSSEGCKMRLPLIGFDISNIPSAHRGHELRSK